MRPLVSIAGFAFDSVNAIKYWVEEFAIKPIGEVFDRAAVDYGDEPEEPDWPTPEASERWAQTFGGGDNEAAQA